MTGLAGRTVVITRALDQAGETAEQVASFGATALVLPLIEIVDDPTGMTELSALALADFDWIVVTSPNGASRVSPLIQPRAVTPKVAAVGSATAEVLPRCDLVASRQSAAGLLEMFPSGSGRVAVIQAGGAASTLVDGLLGKGWEVVAVSPYRTEPLTPTAMEMGAALAADAVLFASGSAARAWVAAFGTRTPAAVVAIGDQTAADAEAAGLKVSTVSTDHSMYGMLVALGRYFSDDN
ncbi:MAG: uroporphyrinogen-III synthase [Ilumatobacteraceae bacterium]